MRASLACLALALMPLAAQADEPQGNWLGMSYVETDALKLVYFDLLDYLGPHTLRTFENAHAWQRRILGWTPGERTTILLKDLSDYGNASTASAPRNRLFFDIAPLSHAFETYPAGERMYTLMNHELVHVAQGDLGNDVERRWRRFFLGKVAPQAEHPESLLYSYLTVPRFTAPRWFHEGAATFMETWMAGGLGRAQGGYDEMVFRAMVRDGVPFHDPLGLESRGVRADFQVSVNAYLYGTRFVTWLAYEHGPDRVVAWLRRDADSERHYAAQFHHVFGESIEAAWARWVAFEQAFQRANLAEVRRQPITPHRTLVDRALGSISRLHFDESTGVLYGAFQFPGVVEHVGALDTRTGEARRLADIKRGMLFRVASFAFDPASGTAFYTADNYALRDLMAVDVRTGEQRMLLEDARIGEMAFNPVDRSLVGIRHASGYAVLVHVPYPYTEWRAVHLFPYGMVPYDLDVSADGRLLAASVAEPNGDQYLRVWDLAKALAGDLAPRSEHRFGDSVPESFAFSRDGRYLYGSSYYTGVSNIYRYEVATGTVEAVSNAESGFFRPVPLSDGRLLVLTYTSAGFVPAIIDPVPLADLSAIRFLGAELAEKHPVVKTWQVPPASTVDETRLVRRQGPYEPLAHLALDNAFPVLQGYKDSVGVGYHVNVADPLGFAKFGLTLAYTPDDDLPGNEQAHVDLTAWYLGLRASLSWNRSDFYDLFGPTKRSRKGFAGKLGYDHLVIYDEPRKLEWTTDFAHYERIDTLPEAQNVPAASDRLTEFETGLRYTDARRSLGAVDDEKGIRWSAYAGLTHTTLGTPVWGRVALDYGWDVPPGNSSVWLRTAAGVVDGDRADPSASFYLGGFGNNYVDSRSEKRYREWYAFPGFGINEISGQSYARAIVEWNAPPHLFDAAGVPALHAAWLRPAVFASTLWTDVDRPGRRRDYQNAGVQVDLRITALHWYPMTLSAGYAVGFRGGRRAGDEWMLSLKIM